MLQTTLDPENIFEYQREKAIASKSIKAVKRNCLRQYFIQIAFCARRRGVGLDFKRTSEDRVAIRSLHGGQRYYSQLLLEAN